MDYIAIATFGTVGAVLRYFVSVMAAQWWQHPFPLGTLAVNLTGCLLLGWFWQKISISAKYPAWFQTGVSTGLIGSFTTFSAFSAETLQLLQADQPFWAFVYVLSSSTGGLLSAWLGTKLARRETGDKDGQS